MLAPWLPPQGYEARPSGKTWCQGWESGHWWVLVGWVVSGPLRPRQMPIFSNDADHVTSRQAVSGTRPRDTGQAPRPGGGRPGRITAYSRRGEDNSASGESCRQFLRPVVSASQSNNFARQNIHSRVPRQTSGTTDPLYAIFGHTWQDVDAGCRTSAIVGRWLVEHFRNQPSRQKSTSCCAIDKQKVNSRRGLVDRGCRCVFGRH